MIAGCLLHSIMMVPHSSVRVVLLWHARAFSSAQPVSFLMHESRSASFNPSSGSDAIDSRHRCSPAASGFGPSLMGLVSSARWSSAA